MSMNRRTMLKLAAAAVAMGLDPDLLPAGEVPGEAPKTPKVRGTYTSILQFASSDARRSAVGAAPAFLTEKHKRAIAGTDSATYLRLLRDCGFDTLFMTIYPLWGQAWWADPPARELVRSAIAAAGQIARVHLGLSLFNGEFCADPSKYPGASRTIQCDGTRPSWVCFFDDGLWDLYTRNAVEMARLGSAGASPSRDGLPASGGSRSRALDGIFLDPESYGPECYLCFCDNCIRKFNAWSGESMPAGLIKPDSWLLARKGLWKKYTVDWHDHEVARHASALREAVHAVDPSLQLSSLLWEYPVAVGADDPRAHYFQQLAIGLGTPEKPAWTLPEHTYYSDASDLDRIIRQMENDLTKMGAADRVRILPGIRLLRRPANSLLDRGRAISDSSAMGYWMYELADLAGKTPIDFEGQLTEPAAKYIAALAEMNRKLAG